MFRAKAVAKFLINGKEAEFIVDNDMPIIDIQIVLNKLIHFCVEKIQEVENEEAQIRKDEEDSKKPKLECNIEPEAEKECNSCV